MQHRIFIAINISDKVKKVLKAFQTETGVMFSGIDNAQGLIKWTRLENLHITLSFVGDVKDEELLDICKAVEDSASRHKSFSLNFDEISFGPDGDYGVESKKTPKIICVRGEQSAQLIKLQQDGDYD